MARQCIAALVAAALSWPLRRARAVDAWQQAGADADLDSGLRPARHETDVAVAIARGDAGVVAVGWIESHPVDGGVSRTRVYEYSAASSSYEQRGGSINAGDLREGSAVALSADGNALAVGAYMGGAGCVAPPPLLLVLPPRRRRPRPPPPPPPQLVLPLLMRTLMHRSWCCRC